jgi:ribosome-binding protein aMBF1 (putative translation factor)
MDPKLCRKAREALGWSPWTLARAAGLAERTILDFESGATTPRPGTLIALRRALGSAASHREGTAS